MHGSPPAAKRVLRVDSTSGAVDALLPLIAEAQARASLAEPPAGSPAARPERSPRSPASPAFAGPVLLIDGRSGSGKTVLATALAAALDAQLVHLDDIYPGWSGLDAASQHVHDELLAGEPPRWQRWDWAGERPAEWSSVDPRRPLVIEGIGSLSRANAGSATFAVWLELDDATRRRRALDRDGAAYEPHWQMWAAQEDAFLAREDPAALADVVVDFTAR
ncbi:nucleoside/nucleotide kinase family protein [Subtercola endophyticus]|uniref:ATP-binding protein n=1 Tax=Subtercola endophyticus TaxID=2895559 RepID=UPI001E4870C6|nr:ATP-binding protein [Subtercola endophyticus]UFS59635.1 ATP-binding protein [Subtercola endophyticus]